MQYPDKIKSTEYPIGRISLLLRCIGYQQHIEDYPDGITATGQHHLRVNIEKILEFFLCDPKTEKPTQKNIHRWMTPKQYEEQKAKNPTLSSILL